MVVHRHCHFRFGLCNRRVSSAIAVFSVGVLVAMFGFAESQPRSSGQTATTAGAWSIVDSPNTSSSDYDQLYGVACPSATDCWAVGYYYDSSIGHSQTLTEHWDGTSWSIVDSANSSASESNFLLGLSCNSASDCWAVGHHESGVVAGSVALFNTLIEH